MAPPELAAVGHRPSSPMQAIRARCLDCCAGSADEVCKCVSLTCPSWPFRNRQEPMRATFITTALENGAQLEDVQKAAGHRDPSTTKLYDRRQTGGDVDAVAEDVVVLDDDVSEIDADAEMDPLAVGQLRVAVNHPALHLDSATDRVDDALKLDQHAVASVFPQFARDVP
jgi:hypothetical protein